jgi:alpha-L-fucosidase
MLIRSLVEVASRGGNFLLNVGPQPDEVIQPEFQERLPTIGSWLSVNGESIYGTTYGPLQGVLSIRTTVKKDKIFVRVFDRPRGPLEIDGLQSECFQLIWCRQTTPLKMQKSEGELRIELTS